MLDSEMDISRTKVVPRVSPPEAQPEPPRGVDEVDREPRGPCQARRWTSPGHAWFRAQLLRAHLWKTRLCQLLREHSNPDRGRGQRGVLTRNHRALRFTLLTTRRGLAVGCPQTPRAE